MYVKYKQIINDYKMEVLMKKMLEFQSNKANSD